LPHAIILNILNKKLEVAQLDPLTGVRQTPQ
jgi:hypothetical protein